MATIFKNLAFLTIAIIAMASCSSEENKMNSYRFISYSCISDDSDFSTISTNFPLNETFYIYDTPHNADKQMLSMFRALNESINSHSDELRITKGDFYRIHLCEVSVTDTVVVVRDITCQEWN